MTHEKNSAIDHRGWMTLATEEYRRLDTLLESLPDEAWLAPTECVGWRVRDVVAHLIGAAEATVGVREQMRQQRLGGAEKGDRLQIDAVNAIQIRERRELSPSDLRAQFRDAVRRGLTARRQTPGLVRAVHFPFPAPVGWASLGFLLDVVYTRDAWMHRVDLCRALGLPFEFTDEHDGRLVAEAAQSWRQVTGADPIVLSRPSGDPLPNFDADGPAYDAVDFARALSGRGELEGIRADVVLF